ncbi:MarR family winged helix-turn-helix transcriptional regulator [Micromonospora sp. NPDC048909]|uniref:MarR family winged helix-turn-helix transcriptional regulator n=1 Tax=Micromonospora sp. NPDC048909 TaxID=3155643 RepID=UPI0034052468
MTTLNGQIIGLAHYATRTLLERELTGLGLTFPQSLALSAVAAQDGAVEPAHLVQRMTGALKIDASVVLAVVGDLTDAGLLGRAPAGGAGLVLTDAGRAVQRRVAEAVTAITARLYGDIPADDLAVAGRVLTLVRQRADAELARAAGGAPPTAV